MASKNVEKGRILRHESARPINFSTTDGKMNDLKSVLHVVLEDMRNDMVTFRNLLMSFPGQLVAVLGWREAHGLIPFLTFFVF